MREERMPAPCFCPHDPDMHPAEHCGCDCWFCVKARKAATCPHRDTRGIDHPAGGYFSSARLAARP
jgi:hypothetical protein